LRWLTPRILWSVPVKILDFANGNPRILADFFWLFAKERL
jgi:hypothetical protein